ncbi:hypothetical protein SDC9_154161 [bioreactor metagenome]|uniref:Uncharacterized protein n=1 Tax=bioreactor metagenome TaxID=1076179 RepID=A0A645F2U0_9ZZZZ
MAFDHIAVQVAGQLLGIEQLLRIEFAVSQFSVLNAVHDQ